MFGERPPQALYNRPKSIEVTDPADDTPTIAARLRLPISDGQSPSYIQHRYSINSLAYLVDKVRRGIDIYLRIFIDLSDLDRTTKILSLNLCSTWVQTRFPSNTKPATTHPLKTPTKNLPSLQISISTRNSYLHLQPTRYIPTPHRSPRPQHPRCPLQRGLSHY